MQGFGLALGWITLLMALALGVGLFALGASQVRRRRRS